MAKYSLLTMVQDILVYTNSDPVNSINDTPEALQVAQIIKTTYNNLISNRNWPQEKRTFALDNVSDTARATYLQLPEDVKELVSIFYDQRRNAADRKQLEKIDYLSPEEFLHRTNSLNELKTNVDLVTDFGGAIFKVRNDVPPTQWTSFDDEYIVFDSYDSTVDTTVQNSNSQATGYVEKSFTFEDTFVPELPSEAFASLLAEAKAEAFVVLRQEVNQRVEREAQRQRTWLSRKAWTAAGGVKYPNYGRKGGNHRNPQFDKT
tara:strand:+ start:9485 stop:10270 length:786 start_codon:yes stop_codon:yes gene_type:complete